MAVTSDPSLEKVFDLGIRRNTDLIFEVSNSLYVNKEIFTRHIKENFINQVDAERKYCGLEENPAILFFDNCSCHLDEELLQILAEHMILVITYPSHTSHVCSGFGFTIVRRFKSQKKKYSKK